MRRSDNKNKEERGRDDGASAVVAFLRAHAPFSDMEPELLGQLADRLVSETFAAGERIGDAADATADTLYIIRHGRVCGEVRDSASGAVWELAPGEMFPVGAMVSKRPARTVARAVEQTECLCLDRDGFDDLFARSRTFSDFCTRRLAALLSQVHRHVQSSALEGLGGDTTLNVTLGERLHRAPVVCAPDTSIREVLRRMEAEHVGSMVIADGDGRPLGVFTLPDLLARVVLPEHGLDKPISTVMTPDPVSLPESAFAFEAAMLMAQHGIRHVCVLRRQRLVGVISERDLFSLQRVGLVTLSRGIARAEDVETLTRIRGDIRLLVEQMIAQGVRAGQITEIISLLNDQVARRVIDLHLREVTLPRMECCWLVFGSEGRREQTLKTDQDNGIIFRVADGDQTADAIRTQLLPVARRINEALDRCGYPLCPGNIMASNPECFLSVDEWQERFRRWVDQGTPEHLLKASIFFDLRAVHGDDYLVDELQGWLLARTAANSRFRKQMAMNAMNLRPPLGIIRDFRLSSGGEHPNTLNLKLNGVAPFVDAARIMALAGGISETNTIGRLKQAAETGLVEQAEAEAWVNAYDYIQMLRMRTNQEQAAKGEPLSNHVSPDRLHALDRRILKEAFREARKLQSRIAADYQL